MEEFSEAAGNRSFHTLMMHELNHRAKNITQLIASSISMQARHSTNPEVRSVLEDATHRLIALSHVHEMLYRASATDCILTGDYLRELTSAILPAIRGNGIEIGWRVAGDNPCWPDSVVTSVGMLVAEALMNIRKHAFTGKAGGNVVITLTSGSLLSKLEIRDDGIGFLAQNGHAGFGSKMMKGVERRLSGELDIVSTPGAGTEIQLTFKTPGLLD